ncbi:MAG: hypothetical protein JWP16_596 [Alphaproteobacteria bacterium]|nr:hypothetical protein [Alphaproteobacteria bacterium]
MPNIKTVDLMLLDDLFEMNSGYVLDFSNATFARFFANELQIDIDDEQFSEHGTSKGRRLKCFLQKADSPTVARTLTALWEYREARRMRREAEEKITNAHARFFELIRRLNGAGPATAAAPPGAIHPLIDNARLETLKGELLGLAAMEPQPRGYAFEGFLKGLPTPIIWKPAIPSACGENRLTEASS